MPVKWKYCVCVFCSGPAWLLWWSGSTMRRWLSSSAWLDPPVTPGFVWLLFSESPFRVSSVLTSFSKKVYVLFLYFLSPSDLWIFVFFRCVEAKTVTIESSFLPGCTSVTENRRNNCHYSHHSSKCPADARAQTVTSSGETSTVSSCCPNILPLRDTSQHKEFLRTYLEVKDPTFQR